MEAEMMRTLNPGVHAGCVCTLRCWSRATAPSRDASTKLYRQSA